jgi:tryptophan synthase alpha chain
MRKPSRIDAAFRRLRRAGGKAFIPYLMAGDGGLRATAERVTLLEECGADVIELGVPFSDPLADGPTIQRAAERALKQGCTLKKVLSVVSDVRTRTEVPLVLMTYYNPVFKYGVDAFVRDAAGAGVDGVIVPDLPPEEGSDLVIPSRRFGLDTVFLVAPTSTDMRIRRIARVSTGFVYYVSMTGITGARLSLEETFRQHIARVRSVTGKPIAVGFGVSGPEDARTVCEVADGVIVGSAIVRKFHEEPEGTREFLLSLRHAIA